MKTSLAALLLSCLLTVSAQAGTPDEDYTVDLTRESFRDGKLPTEADLYPNFQWVCGSYRTEIGNLSGGPGIILNEVFFKKEGNTVYNNSLYFPGKLPLVANANELRSQAVNDDGKVLFFYSIRKNHDGLLVEVAAPVDGSPLVPSIAYDGMHAFTYLYCIPFDAATKAPKVMNQPWGDLYGKDKR